MDRAARNATQLLNTAYATFRKNASAYNYVALQNAMLEYQDVTKNTDAPRTPDGARRTTDRKTPRQTMIERAANYCVSFAPFATIADCHASLEYVAHKDATLHSYYLSVTDRALDNLIRAVQRATDSARFSTVYKTALDNMQDA